MDCFKSIAERHMQKKHAAHVLPWNSEMFPAAELYQNQFAASSILEYILKFKKFFQNRAPTELVIASKSEFHIRELFGKNLRILSEFMSLLGCVGNIAHDMRDIIMWNLKLAVTIHAPFFPISACQVNIYYSW